MYVFVINKEEDLIGIKWDVVFMVLRPVLDEDNGAHNEASGLAARQEAYLLMNLIKWQLQGGKIKIINTKCNVKVLYLASYKQRECTNGGDANMQNINEWNWLTLAE